MYKKLLFISLMSFSGVTLAQTAATAAAATTTTTTTTTAASPAKEEASKEENTSTSTTTTTQTTTVVAKPTTLLTRAPSAAYVGFGFMMPNVHGYTGLMPKLLLGYGRLLGVCKDLYIGAEIFGGAGSMPLSTNQKHRVSSFYGISILPGVLLYETTAILVRLGYEGAHYSKLNRTRSGYVVGLGLQTIFNERWDVRFGYDYMPRGSLNQYSMDFLFKFC